MTSSITYILSNVPKHFPLKRDTYTRQVSMTKFFMLAILMGISSFTCALAN